MSNFSPVARQQRMGTWLSDAELQGHPVFVEWETSQCSAFGDCLSLLRSLRTPRSLSHSSFQKSSSGLERPILLPVLGACLARA